MKDIKWITNEFRMFFDEETNLFYITKKEYEDYADLNIIISSSNDEKEAILKALIKMCEKNEELIKLLNKINKAILENIDVVEIGTSVVYETENIFIETDQETIKFDKLIYDKDQHNFIPLIFKTKKEKE